MIDEMPGATGEMADAQNRRRGLATVLLALIPISVLTALLVLIAMAASSSATGGCGGG
ncbi:MAG TPA: hypothetical protein VMA72_21165 [Streptosporangiaceae bacterium]|nr:hypothetical protein [Streptosporangiaceae bacterium]